MSETNGTTRHNRDHLANLDDDELRQLAEAVEAERRNRRRGLRNLNWNPERRTWERRAL